MTELLYRNKKPENWNTARQKSAARREVKEENHVNPVDKYIGKHDDLFDIPGGIDFSAVDTQASKYTIT